MDQNLHQLDNDNNKPDDVQHQPTTSEQATNYQPPVEPSSAQPIQNFVQPPISTPPPAITPPSPPPAESIFPQPVVKVLSPRGVEYVFLIIALFTSAIALAILLISIINSAYRFSSMSYPIAGLVIGLAVFSLMFLRLKKAELNNPLLKTDASKRRSTQFTQIVAFLVSFFTLIGFVSVIINKLGNNFNGSLFKIFLDVLVIEVIAGGILCYYWRDEHRR